MSVRVSAWLLFPFFLKLSCFCVRDCSGNPIRKGGQNFLVLAGPGIDSIEKPGPEDSGQRPKEPTPTEPTVLYNLGETNVEAPTVYRICPYLVQIRLSTASPKCVASS